MLRRDLVHLLFTADTFLAVWQERLLGQRIDRLRPVISQLRGALLSLDLPARDLLKEVGVDPFDVPEGAQDLAFLLADAQTQLRLLARLARAPNADLESGQFTLVLSTPVHVRSTPARIADALEGVQGLYSVCAILTDAQSGDLTITGADSGSPFSFDLSGLAAVATALLSLFGAARFRQGSARRDAMSTWDATSDLIAKIRDRERQGLHTPDEAAWLIAEVYRSSGLLIGTGAALIGPTDPTPLLDLPISSRYVSEVGNGAAEPLRTTASAASASGPSAPYPRQRVRYGPPTSHVEYGLAPDVESPWPTASAGEEQVPPGGEGQDPPQRRIILSDDEEPPARGDF
jgi:hypothetical protein